MTTIIPERVAKLDQLDIKAGSHSAPPNGKPEGCIMELASWVAGEPWSDRPECASPIITSFLIRWNDRLPSDEARNRLLKPLLLDVVGTRTTDEDEKVRRAMIERWAWDVALPKYLTVAGLEEHAKAVSANPGDRKVLRAASDAAWAKRSDWRSKIRAKVKAVVEEQLAKKPVAVADADAAAAADAAAVADAWWKVRDKVYDAVYKAARSKYDEIVQTDERFAFIPELQASAQQLVRDMCAVGR